MRRVLINQPSTLHHLHHLDGTLGLYDDKSDTFYFLSGDTISMCIPARYLSNGWPESLQAVFKCNHCSSTEKTPSKIAEHEKSCCFNLENKHCYTCKHRYDDYDLSMCSAKVKNHSDFLYNESEVVCIKWEEKIK